jgi:glycosyltransferase involved in cell wall biosynthesis
MMDVGLEKRLNDACAEMEKTLASNMYSRFLAMESNFYEHIVKSRESREHYEMCFRKFEPLGNAYGDILRRKFLELKERYKNNEKNEHGERILFLLPNLDNDLAHIEQLYNILDNHSSINKTKIFVAGYRTMYKVPQSKLLARLADEGKVKLLFFDEGHAGRVQLINFFLLYNFSCLVVYSVPLQLSAWCRALGSESVYWAATKFPLSCFKEVRNRIFGGVGRSLELPDSGVEWAFVTPGLSADSIPRFETDNRNRQRLVSINRAEKIANSSFLDIVSQILTLRPTTSFYWTGRNALPQVEEHFAKDNLSSRVHFIGWVDPDLVLDQYDIFLDTLTLSGTVATKAFASGMPVISVRGAESWLEAFETEVLAQKSTEWKGVNLKNLLVNSVEEYIENVLELIDSKQRYLEQSHIQRQLAERFFNTKKMYDDYMAILVSKVITSEIF